MPTTIQQLDALRDAVQQSIVGQADAIENLLLALLSDGHALLEGLPGLGKTRSVKSVAHALGTKLHRVQFTPDLLPSDVTGSVVYHSEGGTGMFRFEQGPIFGNVVLIDEINRAPAKVQSALLEAMEERQVTVGGETHPLPDPFFVLATQNPIEQEGTHPLPEAQLDRFLLHIEVGYPSSEGELGIMRLVRSEEKASEHAAVASIDILKAARREIVESVSIAENVERYIVDLVVATRAPEKLDAQLQLSAFHFLRPALLYWLIPSALYGLLLIARGAAPSAWAGVVSPQLLPYLLRPRAARTWLGPESVLLASAVIATLAAAGPCFAARADSSDPRDSALIVVFELSRSMSKRDLSPSRAERARLELLDVLHQRSAAPTALVVVAGSAHVLMPFTDDASALEPTVKALSPELMPIDGQAFEQAARRVQKLASGSKTRPAVLAGERRLAARRRRRLCAFTNAGRPPPGPVERGSRR